MVDFEIILSQLRRGAGQARLLGDQEAPEPRHRVCRCSEGCLGPGEIAGHHELIDSQFRVLMTKSPEKHTL